jgi:hypothetical protein
MKIRVFLEVTPFRIRIYKKKNHPKLDIHSYENLEFQTVYEKEIVCDLWIA